MTAVHDKDGWLGALRFFQRLRRQEALTLRVWQSLPAESLDHLEEVGLASGLGDDLLRAGYLKTFMDGTLGSQTARLLDGSGVEITSRAELAEIVRRAARLGWPVGVHAIGDRANRDALDAFEETAADWRPRGLRQRIEHAQLLDPADIPRFAALGVAASVQFSHAPSDRDVADASGRDTPSAPTPTAPSATPARCSRTAPTPPSRSSTRSPASERASCARSTTARAGTRSRP